LKTFVSLEELKTHKKLQGMRLLQKGNRLSILPVTKEEFEFIVKLTN
jgi:predicted RNA-binding protein with PUA-like domain